MAILFYIILSILVFGFAILPFIMIASSKKNSTKIQILSGKLAIIWFFFGFFKTVERVETPIQNVEVKILDDKIILIHENNYRIINYESEYNEFVNADLIYFYDMKKTQLAFNILFHNPIAYKTINK